MNIKLCTVAVLIPLLVACVSQPTVKKDRDPQPVANVPSAKTTPATTTLIAMIRSGTDNSQ